MAGAKGKKSGKQESEIEKGEWQLEFLVPGMGAKSITEEKKPRPRRVVHVQAQQVAKWEATWGWAGVIRGKNVSPTYQPPPPPSPPNLED